jgi:hypothetical protein
MATLIISGAGFNLFNQIGALEVVFAQINKHCHQHFTKYENFAGTSAGGIFSVLLAMEWDPVAMAQWFIDPVNYALVESIIVVDPTNIVTIGSIFAPAQLISFLSLLVQQTPIYQQYFAGVDPITITFDQLYAVTKKGVLINATNITNTVPYLPLEPCSSVPQGRPDKVWNLPLPQTMSPGRPEIFSVFTSPDVSVVTAMLAGMSLLPLIPPTQINGQLYLDGIYTQDYPAPLYDPTNENYYKTLYPNVEIPVDLCKSAGIWYIDPVFFTPPTVPWSLQGLISYIPNLSNFAAVTQIEVQQPAHFFKHHTILLSGIPVTTLPPISTIEAQYALGREQAEAQKDKLEHK